jgi:hypothetical protein
MLINSEKLTWRFLHPLLAGETKKSSFSQITEPAVAQRADSITDKLPLSSGEVSTRLQAAALSYSLVVPASNKLDAANKKIVIHQ